ncbi:MAG: ferredoxin--NADP reductase [bacterium]
MNNLLYNATVNGKILINPDLMILRIKTDTPRNSFEAGQFTALGLMVSEQRAANSVMRPETLSGDKMIKRPYSIASANHETQDFEFYISHVKSGQLTPRLFNLQQGSRLWIDNKILGVFKLNDTPKGLNIVMIATGTGLAPYISFLRSHIKDNQNIKLAVIHGASFSWDLGYYGELQLMDSLFDNFNYYPTLLDAKPDTWTGLSGMIEKHLEDGILLRDSGIEINPEKTHFFLCGNPKMVESVSSFLSKYNYTKHTSKNPGAMHIEEY